MTPKEKAEKLFKKYISICNNWSSKFIEFKTIKELKKELIQNEWFIPKKCALIAVDEIINVVKRYETKKGRLLIDNINLLYWQEVKQEMQKL